MAQQPEITQETVLSHKDIEKSKAALQSKVPTKAALNPIEQHQATWVERHRPGAALQQEFPALFQTLQTRIDDEALMQHLLQQDTDVKKSITAAERSIIPREWLQSFDVETSIQPGETVLEKMLGHVEHMAQQERRRRKVEGGDDDDVVEIVEDDVRVKGLKYAKPILDAREGAMVAAQRNTDVFLEALGRIPQLRKARREYTLAKVLLELDPTTADANARVLAELEQRFPELAHINVTLNVKIRALGSIYRSKTNTKNIAALKRKRDAIALALEGIEALTEQLEEAPRQRLRQRRQSQLDRVQRDLDAQENLAKRLAESVLADVQTTFDAWQRDSLTLDGVEQFSGNVHVLVRLLKKVKAPPALQNDVRLQRALDALSAFVLPLRLSLAALQERRAEVQREKDAVQRDIRAPDLTDTQRTEFQLREAALNRAHAELDVEHRVAQQRLDKHSAAQQQLLAERQHHAKRVRFQEQHRNAQQAEAVAQEQRIAALAAARNEVQAKFERAEQERAALILEQQQLLQRSGATTKQREAQLSELNERLRMVNATQQEQENELFKRDTELAHLKKAATANATIIEKLRGEVARRENVSVELAEANAKLDEVNAKLGEANKIAAENMEGVTIALEGAQRERDAQQSRVNVVELKLQTNQEEMVRLQVQLNTMMEQHARLGREEKAAYEAKMSVVQSQFEVAKENAESMRTALQQRQQKIVTLEAKLVQQHILHEKALDKTKLDFKSQFDALHQEKMQLETRLTKMHEVQRDLDEAREDLVAKQTLNQRFKAEINTKNAELQNLRNDLDVAKETATQQLIAQKVEQEAQLNQLKQQHQAQLTELNVKLEDKNKALQELGEKNNTLKKRVNSLQADKASLQLNIDNLNADIATAHEALLVNQAKTKELEEDVKKEREAKAKLQDNVATLEATVQGLEKEKHVLGAQVNLLQDELKKAPEVERVKVAQRILDRVRVLFNDNQVGQAIQIDTTNPLLIPQVLNAVADKHKEVQERNQTLINELQRDGRALRARAQRRGKRLKDIFKTVDTKLSEVLEKNTALQEKLEVELTKQQGVMHGAEGKVRRLGVQLQLLVDKINEDGEDRAKLNKKLTIIVQNLNDAKDNVAALQERNNDLVAQIAQLEAQNKALSDKNATLNVDLNAANATIVKLKQDLEAFKGTKAELEQRNQDLVRAETELNVLKEAQVNLIATHAKQLEERAYEIAGLRADLVEENRLRQVLQVENNGLNKNLLAKNKALKVLERDMNEVQGERSRLEQALQKMQHNHNIALQQNKQLKVNVVALRKKQDQLQQNMTRLAKLEQQMRNLVATQHNRVYNQLLEKYKGQPDKIAHIEAAYRPLGRFIELEGRQDYNTLLNELQPLMKKSMPQLLAQFQEVSDEQNPDLKKQLLDVALDALSNRLNAMFFDQTRALMDTVLKDVVGNLAKEHTMLKGENVLLNRALQNVGVNVDVNVKRKEVKLRDTQQNYRRANVLYGELMAALNNRKDIYVKSGVGIIAKGRLNQVVVNKGNMKSYIRNIMNVLDKMDNARMNHNYGVDAAQDTRNFKRMFIRGVITMVMKEYNSALNYAATMKELDGRLQLNRPQLDLYRQEVSKWGNVIVGFKDELSRLIPKQLHDRLYLLSDIQRLKDVRLIDLKDGEVDRINAIINNKTSSEILKGVLRRYGKALQKYSLNVRLVREQVELEVLFKRKQKDYNAMMIRAENTLNAEMNRMAEGAQQMWHGGPVDKPFLASLREMQRNHEMSPFHADIDTLVAAAQEQFIGKEEGVAPTQGWKGPAWKQVERWTQNKNLHLNGVGLRNTEQHYAPSDANMDDYLESAVHPSDDFFK